MSNYCAFHDEEVEAKTYRMPRFAVETTKSSYDFGVLKLTEQLSEYAMAKGFHLSGTQILLLRPDIFIPYLEKKHFTKEYEKVLNYEFVYYPICEECYQKVRKAVPLT